ncbi:response regulator transcription factor [Streptomyces sp. NPDC003717]|uniref:response regulator transcription factor n=1 Tax=Streptomyces sp. NPDC003717 TaxID=3154276 RepID=UPI0033B3D188
MPIRPPVATPRLRVVVADDNPVVRAGLTALLSGRGDIAVVAEAADGREACAAAHHHRPDVVLLDVRMPELDGLSALPYLASIAPVLMLTYSTEPETIQEALRRGAGGYLVHGEFTAAQLVAAVRDVKAGRTHVTPTAADALVARLRRDASTPIAEAHATHSPTLPMDRLPGMNLRTPLSQSQRAVGQSNAVPASGRSRHQLSTREVEIMDLIASGLTNQQIATTCFISEKTVKNHINRIFAKLHSHNRSEATAKWLGLG